MAVSSTDSSASLLVTLPDMIQSIAAQRRDGMLIITVNTNERRRLRFAAGQLVGIDGPAANFFARALVWSQVLTPEQLTACLAAVGKTATPEQIVAYVQQQQLVTQDGLLDAIDCYIEESFSELTGWASTRVDFEPQISANPWLDCQAALGTSVNSGSLLLEGLRRQDELSSIAALLPNPWDVLVLDGSKALPAELGADARLIVEGWREGMITHALIDRSLLAPFRATIALAQLLRLSVVRVATAEELVVHADAAYSHGRHRDAFGLYRRAQALGVDTPRLHVHIGELAERFGDHALAAKEYVLAAVALKDPSHAVVLLRNALTLGGERLPALEALLAIYQQLDEREEAVAALMEIARLRTEAGDRDQAAQAYRTAQSLGADPVFCAVSLARLAAFAGDRDQAATQFELAAHAAQFAGRHEDAVASWQALLELRPDQPEYARECAELLVTLNRSGEAIAVLQSARDRCTGASDEALIPLYELLAKLSPNDTTNHDWLARAYGRCRDRDGATAQLLLLADAQERAGDLSNLAATLERIVELGSSKPEIWQRLAQARVLLRQSGLAEAAWCSAIDAFAAQNNLRSAIELADRALESDPGCLPLRSRRAQLAIRANDAVAAAASFRAAADLARGAGRLAEAREALHHLVVLRPDDLLTRIEMAEISRQLADPELDQLYREVVRIAVRTGNLGLAVDFARRRVATAVGPEQLAARGELVELLRRSGDTAAELAEGKALVDVLLEQGVFEQAVQFLSRLVASHNRNPDLLLQLADLHQSIDETRQAHRFYRHAVVLLQVEGRRDEAHRALDQILTIQPDDETVALARQRLEQGQAIDWDALRQAKAKDERRRLADDMGVPATPPDGIVKPSVS